MKKDSREEIRKAYGDAVYDAWRRGLNSDAVDYERVRDNYYGTYSRSLAAKMEVDRLALERERRRRENEVREEPTEDEVHDE